MSEADDDEFAALRAEERNAILRLFGEYGREQLPQFVVGGVASVLQMSMELVPAFVLSVAIDSLFFDTTAFTLPFVPGTWLPEGKPEQFVLATAIIGAAYACNSVFGWLNSYMWNNFAQHFQHEARVDTYDALQRRSTDFFDNKQTGEVMSILNNVHESGALVSQPERVAFW